MGDQILFRHRPDCTRGARAADRQPDHRHDGRRGRARHRGRDLHRVVRMDLAGRRQTGTADLNKAIWFGGFTRQVVTAVWVGSQGTPYPLEDRFGGDLFGSSLPAPIWKAYMQEIMSDMPELKFPEPQLIDIPNVVGMDEEEARKLLKKLRLKVKAVEVDDYRPKGPSSNRIRAPERSRSRAPRSRSTCLPAMRRLPGAEGLFPRARAGSARSSQGKTSSCRWWGRSRGTRSSGEPSSISRRRLGPSSKKEPLSC